MNLNIPYIKFVFTFHFIITFAIQHKLQDFTHLQTIQYECILYNVYLKMNVAAAKLSCLLYWSNARGVGGPPSFLLVQLIYCHIIATRMASLRE